jgi:hypothetical protein
MSLGISRILLPPIYRYFKLGTSSICSGKEARLLPLILSSLRVMREPKDFEKESQSKLLFLAMRDVRGHSVSVSGKCNNPLELTSSTFKFLNLFIFNGSALIML